APVDSRRSFTIAAVIVAIADFPFACSDRERRGSTATPPQPPGIYRCYVRAEKHRPSPTLEHDRFGKPGAPLFRNMRFDYSASAVSFLACATQASARLGRPTSSPI